MLSVPDALRRAYLVPSSLNGARHIEMAHHSLSVNGNRTTLGRVPAVFVLVLVGALVAPAVGASTKPSAKAVFAAARARLIKESQLAGHWTTSSYGSGSSGGGSNSSGGSSKPNNVSQCSNVSEPGVDQNPYFVEGNYFDQKGTNAEVQEELDVYPSSKQAIKDVQFANSSAFQSCFQSLFSQQKSSIASSVGKGATVGAITIESLPIAKFGQQSAEFRLVIPIVYQGVTVNLDYDYVAIAVGNYEAELDESDLATPLPAKIATNFQTAVVQSIKNG
jgi:hypothetical protein